MLSQMRSINSEKCKQTVFVFFQPERKFTNLYLKTVKAKLHIYTTKLYKYAISLALKRYSS